jgi:molecular chaperone HscC
MIIGIDLGTTNSLCAAWHNGEARIIPNVHGHNMTPSVVGIDDDGDILVGLPARERLLLNPQITTSLFKRYMGSNKTAKLGERSFRPEELSSLILRSLKEDAERFLGEKVTEAIITVPAYFNDTQRKATKIAGELAGLKVDRLLNEPTAAALAYGLHQRDMESTFLVFDLGGGTFDVSILQLFEGVMEVRASAGDNFLGGEDFVTVLLDAFLNGPGQALRQQYAAEHNADHFEQAHRLEQVFRKEAERVKRALSDNNTAEFKVLWQENTYTWTITETEFAKLAEPLLVRLRTPIERALRDSRMRTSDLNEIVLAGGASRMPLVRKMVARLFGRLPAIHLNPDELVARGAAVQAGLTMGDAALDEIVMTDVCPYTLGTEVSERYGNDLQSGIYLPIIERNSIVPISREKSLTTMHDDQKFVNIRIFQGESREVKDNVFLGELEVPVPQRPAGGVSLTVRYTYTVDGLLEAECTVGEAKEKHRLVIEKNPGSLSPEQVAERLAHMEKLKIHPREQLENTLTLNRMQRMYEEYLGEERAYIGQLIGRFQRELQTQDARLISEARREINKLLDNLEGELRL